MTHVGSYINIEPECDGQDPSLSFCEVEMSKVIQETGLTRGELIVVRIKARNENGWEAFSQQNIDGAVIATEPLQVENLDFDIALSSNS